MRVEVNRDLLQWAIVRAGDRRAFLYEKFPKLDEWESGDSQPTLKQLEQFAKAAYVPIGYLFLPEPPEEKLPVPDLRTLESRGVPRPSPDLLDTIYAMQHRQEGLREDRIECEAEPLDFVGSARQTDNPAGIGQEMRRTVGLVDGWAANVGTWQESVGELRRAIESIGVTVVVNGIVGNNTHRKLEVGEFRGFAAGSDVYAPVDLRERQRCKISSDVYAGSRTRSYLAREERVDECRACRQIDSRHRSLVRWRGGRILGSGR